MKKENVLAKRALHKQLRKEKYDDRKNFYGELMSNPASDKFNRLKRRNKGSAGSVTCILSAYGKEIVFLEKQRKAFAQYYEDLSVPKDENCDSAFFELCSVRHNLVEQLCAESDSNFKPISKNEVSKAILQLK